MNTDRIREVAAGWDRGWSFTPLIGKRPLLYGWQDRPRESRNQAIAWARAGNVGLRTGSISGVYVIDIDLAKGGVIPAGLPETVTVETGGGGIHLYYAMPPGVTLGNSAGRLGPHIDTRGDGGQVVFVGSVHPETGAVYQWADGHSPDDRLLAAQPSRLVPKLTEPRHHPVAPPTHTEPDALTRCLRYMDRMDPAISGSGGHNATFRAACVTQRKFHLSVDDAWAAMVWWNENKCFPRWTERELRHKLDNARASACEGAAV